MISWLCRFPFFPYCSPDALYFMRCTALYTSFEKIFNQDVEFTITVTLTCIHHIVYVIANNVCHSIIISDHSCIILSWSGSCLRDVMSSFENILCRVVFTVFSLIPSFSDISLFIMPDAAHDATWDSRFVSPRNLLPRMAVRHFSRFAL